MVASLRGMNPAVAEYLRMTQGSVKLPVVTEDEIVIGRISLKVFPAVESDEVERIFMEFPQDLQPDEAAIPMLLKACLVGYEELLPLMPRIQESLDAGREHRETLGPWHLRFAVKDGIRSINATPTA